jgi:signal transduction histidine kinase/phage shock protein PspC (stress-responsive transcriptional regulator)
MAAARRLCQDAPVAAHLPASRALGRRASARRRFRRSARGRVLTGVVGGLAERFEVEPFTARLLAILLGLAGGAGLVAYLAAWTISTEPDPRVTPPHPAVRRTVAAACVTAGVLLLLRGLPLWPGDELMGAAAAAAVGAGILAWRRRLPDLDPGRRAAAGTVTAVFSGRVSPARLLAGGVLVVAGVALLAGGGSLEAIARAVRSVALALLGATIVLGPWLGRLVEQLNAERRERIRSEERAAMTAHLHDSVLQTLALIQRSPDDPRRTARLARRQERELRAWLYGDRDRLTGPVSLATAAERLVEEVEADHDVRIDLVVVGDRALDERTETLLSAVREAAVNAAKHAGAETVSVYLEAEPAVVTAFVRDRGRGFEPALVPADRHGIADSIVGRVERVGGTACIASAPGEGTEVQLSVPVRAEPGP